MPLCRRRLRLGPSLHDASSHSGSCSGSAPETAAWRPSLSCGVCHLGHYGLPRCVPTFPRYKDIQRRSVEHASSVGAPIGHRVVFALTRWLPRRDRSTAPHRAFAALFAGETELTHSNAPSSAPSDRHTRPCWPRPMTQPERPNGSPPALLSSCRNRCVLVQRSLARSGSRGDRGYARSPLAR